VLPLLVLLLSCGFVLNDYFRFWPQEKRLNSLWEAALLPVIAVLLTLVILYILIIFLLPIRWPAIRGTFHRRLTARLTEDLSAVYLPLPQDLADAFAVERRQIDQLIAEGREVADWLHERERAANIEGLYGTDR